MGVGPWYCCIKYPKLLRFLYWHHVHPFLIDVAELILHSRTCTLKTTNISYTFLRQKNPQCFFAAPRMFIFTLFSLALLQIIKKFSYMHERTVDFENLLKLMLMSEAISHSLKSLSLFSQDGSNSYIWGCTAHKP